MKKNKGGSIIGQAQEPRVQSKVNSALSYGRATGKTYINKGTASKSKGGANLLTYFTNTLVQSSAQKKKKNGAR